MGLQQKSPQSPEEAKSSATGFPSMPGALTLDSTDAGRSWAPASQAVGGRKGSFHYLAMKE